jgi:hypothetical protein
MNKKHDALFRWLFSKTERTRALLELAAKHNAELRLFLESINLDTLERIPDSYSEVDDTGEADLAFRVNVSTGAPVIVGILLEHKSGRDNDVLNQISRYVHSVMKNLDEKRVFDGLPTMAIIFYNGRENWNPLKYVEEGYPEYWHGRVLPYSCTFVNMASIPDEACFACEDVYTAMGVIAMKYAYDGEKIAKILPNFKDSLKKLTPAEVTCLLEKLKLYLREYLGEDFLKEFGMAFVSIGQKYGFVSIGDAQRKEIADAREEERSKANAEKKELLDKADAEKREIAKGLRDDGVPMDIIVRRTGFTESEVRSF